MKIIWVSTNGNDTTGNGNRDLPYLTIERALQDMNNGDQIRLLDGTYTPTDSIMISGIEGSIFAENVDEVYIRPKQTKLHRSCLAIFNSSRFTVQGLNILQATDKDNALIGIYAENVENFIAYTCSVSGFENISGSTEGIFASGSGRIENCKVFNMSSSGNRLIGIRSINIDIVDCETTSLSGSPTCNVTGIYAR